MALALLGVQYRSDKRDKYLHHGNWLLKLGLWMAFCILPFFFPNSLVNAYGAVPPLPVAAAVSKCSNIRIDVGRSPLYISDLKEELVNAGGRSQRRSGKSCMLR